MNNINFNTLPSNFSVCHFYHYRELRLEDGGNYTTIEDKELCESMDDFRFSTFLQMIGIARTHPSAEFIATKRGAVVVDKGKMLRSWEVVSIDPIPIFDCEDWTAEEMTEYNMLNE